MTAWGTPGIRQVLHRRQQKKQANVLPFSAAAGAFLQHLQRRGVGRQLLGRRGAGHQLDARILPLGDGEAADGTARRDPLAHAGDVRRRPVIAVAGPCIDGILQHVKAVVQQELAEPCRGGALPALLDG